MTYELKPCPFCGGEAKWVFGDLDEVSRLVNCTGCGASISSHDPSQNACANWNQRTAIVGEHALVVKVRLGIDTKEAVNELSDLQRLIELSTAMKDAGISLQEYEDFINRPRITTQPKDDADHEQPL